MAWKIGDTVQRKNIDEDAMSVHGFLKTRDGNIPSDIVTKPSEWVVCTYRLPTKVMAYVVLHEDELEEG